MLGSFAMATSTVHNPSGDRCPDIHHDDDESPFPQAARVRVVAGGLPFDETVESGADRRDQSAEDEASEYL